MALLSYIFEYKKLKILENLECVHIHVSSLFEVKFVCSNTFYYSDTLEILIIIHLQMLNDRKLI